MTGGQSKTSWPRWQWVALAGLVIAAAWLRAHDLGKVFFWWDETDFFNENIYGPHPVSLVRFALATKASTTNTWGWPAIVWLFCKALGPTLTAARVPSVLAGTAAVLAIFVLVYRLLDGRFFPALFAAALAAVSMPQLEHSQRVYAYAAIPLMAALLLLAHFDLLRALPEKTPWPRLRNAAALYTLAGAASLCIHPSLALLLGASVVLLGSVEARVFFRREPAARRRALLTAGVMAAVLMFSAVLNKKYPKLGFRAYLVPYYHPLSLGAIPKLLMHAYDLAAYHLNLFFNPSLYWPEALNPLILPLICLCVLGWTLAFRGRFGAYARHFALLGLAAVLIPAGLSTLRAFPFGGVRQTLFLSPLLFAFTAIGFYALGANRLARLAGGAIALGYLTLWAINLPRFYEDRVMTYRAEDIVKLWKESGSLPSFAWKATGPLRYVLRNYPDMNVQRPNAEGSQFQAPFFLISPNHALGRDAGFVQSLRQDGLVPVRLAETPTKHSESERYPTCLYFPPNGFAVYKIVRQGSE